MAGVSGFHGGEREQMAGREIVQSPRQAAWHTIRLPCRVGPIAGGLIALIGGSAACDRHMCRSLLRQRGYPPTFCVYFMFSLCCFLAFVYVLVCLSTMFERGYPQHARKARDGICASEGSAQTETLAMSLYT